MSAANTPFSGRDLLAALSVVVIWGLNFVAMKWALVDFTPFQLGVWRYVFAVLPLVFIVRRPAVPWRWVIAYGLCQGVGQFGVLFIALQVGMTAALASVLMQTQLFFTALLGVLLLGEQLSRPLKWGLVWAAVGLGCFAMNYLGGAVAAGTTLLGFVLNLVSAAMWAASNIVARRTQQVAGSYDALGFVVWSAVVPIVPFMLLSLVFDAPALRWQWLDAPLSSWLAVAYLGWCATIMAYALWTGLLKRHPASRVAPFSLGVPVIGLAAGMGMLGERITLWQWAGGACIVMALVVVLVGARWQARR
jgi:O-acetylserine/cysteine efflux transporter